MERLDLKFIPVVVRRRLDPLSVFGPMYSPPSPTAHPPTP